MNDMDNNNEKINIPADIMRSQFLRILLKHGFTRQKAELCAEIFTTNSLEGVYSHGYNRFPRFVNNVIDGYVKPDAEPSLISSAGSLEQWNGNLGPGPLNAVFATERAMELATSNGISIVSLADTNHWMRGGTYGWMAARKGFILISWTNTEANMPAWGATDPRLGNNPLVIAIPLDNEAIVLDFAMTQFSYGKLETYKISGDKLPVPGGFDDKGNLTIDPEVILSTRRALPIGFWKGAGLSLLLDILATVISGGSSTAEITSRGVEYCVSQIFIAVNPGMLANHNTVNTAINSIISDYKNSKKEHEKGVIRYPGENILNTRSENLRKGIPVNRVTWNHILSL